MTSVGIEAEGELDFKKVQAWLSTLLRVRYMGLRAGATPSWHVCDVGLCCLAHTVPVL